MNTPRLHVGNLPFGASEESLTELFKACGAVVEVAIPKDRSTGDSRGFGFVTMANVVDAKAAVEKLDGVELGGRKLRVTEAEARERTGAPRARTGAPRERNGYARTGGRNRQ